MKQFNFVLSNFLGVTFVNVGVVFCLSGVGGSRSFQGHTWTLLVRILRDVSLCAFLCRSLPLLHQHLLTALILDKFISGSFDCVWQLGGLDVVHLLVMYQHLGWKTF